MGRKNGSKLIIHTVWLQFQQHEETILNLGNMHVARNVFYTYNGGRNSINDDAQPLRVLEDEVPLRIVQVSHSDNTKHMIELGLAVIGH